MSIGSLLKQKRQQWLFNKYGCLRSIGSMYHMFSNQVNLPTKWSSVNNRSGAGQEKSASQRLMS